MESLHSEINITSKLPLVAQAYLTADEDRVVVELQVNPQAGLPTENLLFFRAQTFTVHQANQAILRITRKSAKRA